MDASDLTTLRQIATQYYTAGNQGPTGPTGASIGSLNYAQATPSQVIMATGATIPFIIASVTITTRGNPVQLSCSADMNAVSNEAWARMQFFRDATPIGQQIQAEAGPTAGQNANIPFNSIYIDAPAAGTYTYSCKVVGISFGNPTVNPIRFGEVSGPTIYAIELASALGPVGPTGPGGAAGAAGSAGVTGSTGPMGSSYANWTNTGNIVFGATTSIPTASINAPANTMSYRQIGAKQWEVSMIYQFGTAGLAGSGDYLFTLPNGLAFDTTQPMQIAYTGNVGTSTWLLAAYALPASGLITTGTVGGQVYPIIWNANAFRVLGTSYGATVQCWGSGNYPLSITSGGINLRFQFTST